MSRISASHILVQNEFEARDLQRKLAEGVPFEALAQQFSRCPSGRNGGALGFFSREQMVESFSDAALALRPGEISEPVRTRFGYHLIRRDG